MDAGIERVNSRVKEEGRFVADLQAEMAQVIVGQSTWSTGCSSASSPTGTCCSRACPGLAKTLSVRTLAALIDATFQRIQFTPDLLPADLVGTLIYNPKRGDLHHPQGPDLRQHHPRRRDQPRPRQGAERAARGDAGAAGHDRRRRPSRCREPFLVLATQNPIEQEGTYPLPEAQVDRFMLKLRVGYPSREEERQILDRMAVDRHGSSRSSRWSSPRRSCGPAQVVDEIYVDEKIKDYILDIVFATREPEKYGLDAQGAASATAPRRAPPSTSRSPPRRTPSCRAAAT